MFLQWFPILEIPDFHLLVSFADSETFCFKETVERVEPAVGIEPTTDGLQNRCSTAELSWLKRRKSCLGAVSILAVTGRVK